jgi:hypothetical protein
MNNIELLQKIDLQDRLEFCRSKKQEYEDHIKQMCEYADDYKDMFETRISTLEFHAYKYKDSETYDQVIRAKKMYNMLKYFLNGC